MEFGEQNGVCSEHTGYPVTAKDVEGRWFVTFGTDPIKDCISCQTFKLTKDEAKIALRNEFTLGEDMEINSDEKTGVITSDGKIEFVGSEMGLTFTETWDVLTTSANALVVKYCRTRAVDGAFSEGYRVLTKSGRLSQEDQVMISFLFNGTSISLDDMCKLTPKNSCAASNYLF